MKGHVWSGAGGHAVAKLQGEDLLPQGRVEDQDKSSYFSLSSHHSLRRNTNWDCSNGAATVCCWLQGLQGWLSVCLTAWGRGLTVLLHRQGRLRERVASAHNPSVPDYYEHRSATKLIKVEEHYLGNKIIKTDGSVWILAKKWSTIFQSPLVFKWAWVLTLGMGPRKSWQSLKLSITLWPELTHIAYWGVSSRDNNSI